MESVLRQIIPLRTSSHRLPPRYIASLRVNYPPFVLRPPASLRSKRSELITTSGYYHHLSQLKQTECEGQDICVNPNKYASIYAPLAHPCKDRQCASRSDYLVFFQPEYTIGSIDIIEKGFVPFDYVCTASADHSAAALRPVGRILTFAGPVMYLVSPGAGTFTHFVDTVLPRLVQMETLLSDPNLHLVVDVNDRHPLVKQLYMRLGFKESQIVDYHGIRKSGDGVQALALILGCRAPPMHPYLWQRAQYLLRLPHLQNPLRYHRRTIVYTTRRTGTIGDARQVINEKAVEAALTAFANTNGYNFVTYSYRTSTSLEDQLEFWSDVRVIVGPHGGALGNMLFMKKRSVVIELMPNGKVFTGVTFKDHLSYYQQASMLGHVYFALMCPFARNDDVTVDVAELTNVLEELVGKGK